MKTRFRLAIILTLAFGSRLMAAAQAGPTPSIAAQAAVGSSSSPSTPRAQAAGGGPGMVWVNMSSNVYHCPGKQFYGTTKNGKYMSEPDATAMGARADHNKPCPR